MIALYLALLFTGVALFVLSYVAPFRIAALMRLRYPQHWRIIAESDDGKGKPGAVRLWLRMQYALRSPALPAIGDRTITGWRNVWRYSQWLGWLCWLVALAMRLLLH